MVFSDVVPRNDLYRYSKLYPVLSNVIYFFLAAYIIVKTICLSRCKNKADNKTYALTIALLVIISIFIILSGIFSIVYHMNTPGYTEIPKYGETEKYKESLSLDSGFAMTSAIIALIALIVYSINYKSWEMFMNSNFWALVAFSVVSIFSYVGAGVFWKAGYQECENIENKQEKGTPCFKDYQTLYNMYHSSWHLFIGFAGFFWIWLFFDLMKPRLMDSK